MICVFFRTVIVPCTYVLNIKMDYFYVYYPFVRLACPEANPFIDSFMISQRKFQFSIRWKYKSTLKYIATTPGSKTAIAVKFISSRTWIIVVLGLPNCLGVDEEAHPENRIPLSNTLKLYSPTTCQIYKSSVFPSYIFLQSIPSLPISLWRTKFPKLWI